MSSDLESQPVTRLLQAAHLHARRGWAVFPLHGIVKGRCTCGRRDCSSPGKHPLVRSGLHEASTDTDTIEEWWTRWPLANIGVATGAKSGIVVIDIDLPRALGSLDELVHNLPSTLTGLTGGGGLHLIYRSKSVPSSSGPCTCGPASLGEEQEQSRSTAQLRCTTGRLPGINSPLPGVDLRAEGGYIVSPPSMHISGTRYEWLDPNAEIAPAPEWLRQPQRSSRPIVPVAPRFTTGAGTAYGLAVLRNQLEILSRAQVGERNHTLNRCAFIVARYVSSGHLSDSFAHRELVSTALAIGLPEPEARRTLDSGFTAGAREPRSAPHRLQ